MALNEKFGKLVLLEELDDGPLGKTFRAARVKPSGLDRIVTLLRYSQPLSAHAEVASRLMDQARKAARIQVPGLLQVLGIGRVEQSYYCTFELFEGRTLRAVIDRAGREGFPFAAENALTVASRAAAALHALHGRQDAEGRVQAHGLVTPSHLLVTWEGDVKVSGLGAWPSLRDTTLLGEAGRRYLAPEQAGGGAADVRSDIYSLALVLLEVLTKRAPDGSDPLQSLDQARFVTTTGEEEPLPAPLEELLRRALALDPDARYESMGDVRQAIDALLFSGDFAPTTFNLAYFMQTIFREDMEREAAALEEARRADYTAFLPPPPPPEPSSGAESAEAAPAPTADSEDHPPGRRAPTRTLAEALIPPPAPPATSPPEAAAPRPAPQGPDASEPSGSGRRPRSRLSAEGSGRMFARAGQAGADRRGLALLAGLALAVVGGGGGGYLYFVKVRPLAATTTAATLSPDAEAAMARVRDLEAQLAALQQEKAEAMAREAERRAEEQSEAAPTPAPDETEAAAAAAAETARRRAVAREEARRRALAEQERREAEIRRLEEEMKVAEAVLVAQQAQTSDAEVLLPGVLPPPPTPVPTPAPVIPGELVSIDDPEVEAPELLAQEPVEYPAAAWNARREGVVVVEALVDETGSVTEARVLEVSVSGLGFERAAIQRANRLRYRPATKRGVPVRVRIRLRVNFTLP